MYIVFFVLGIIIDQVTKLWAFNNLKDSADIVIINKWLNLTYVENSGAAWGIFKDATIIFVILTVLICGGILFYLLKNSNNIESISKLCFVMIMSGAIGNLIDRIRLGFVIDFIYTPLGGLYSFPVFNFADIFVSVSAVVLIIYVYFFEGKNVN